MSLRLWRCNNVRTAGGWCSSLSEVQLAQALGLFNPWLPGDTGWRTRSCHTNSSSSSSGGDGSSSGGDSGGSRGSSSSSSKGSSSGKGNSNRQGSSNRQDSSHRESSKRNRHKRSSASEISKQQNGAVTAAAGAKAAASNGSGLRQAAVRAAAAAGQVLGTARPTPVGPQQATQPSQTSSSSSGSSSTGVPAGHVSYQTYALPSYATDEEEQDSLDKAAAVIERLQSSGYMALIVGGWVRDKYLGRRASDIDISTNATPRELKTMFRDVVELPRSTVKLSHQGEVLELTCFRGISRAPSMFGVAMDAARRDFTINALYYDPIKQHVLDFVGGVADAEARTLRLTADPRARLAEDPLRALRCVRFVAVHGLRMAPETAAAVQGHAHLCSVQHGLPPRRIWIELRKLHKAEQQQPGSWARSLKLCYHLGLLQHIFPWLQSAGQQHMRTSMAQQAVKVAEQLQQRHAADMAGSAGGADGSVLPLGLMVAATVHPSRINRQEVYAQLEQYFSWEPAELDAIRALQLAAALTHNGEGSSVADSADSAADTGNVSSSGSSSSSSSGQSDAWVQFYAHEHAATCLQILACWMPAAFANSFKQIHEARMVQLADRIAQRKQLLHAQQEQQRQADRRTLLATGAPAAAAAAGSEALQQRRRRQREELAAAIQALVGEQEQQQDHQQQQHQQEQQHEGSQEVVGQESKQQLEAGDQQCQPGQHAMLAGQVACQAADWGAEQEPCLELEQRQQQQHLGL